VRRNESFTAEIQPRAGEIDNLVLFNWLISRNKTNSNGKLQDETDTEIRNILRIF